VNINKIAYQGDIGSYSYELLINIFPNIEAVPCSSFSELISYVKIEKALGLLPVENSIAGTVNEAYEELIESNLNIFGEYIKKIDHALIGLPNSELGRIKKVKSHPQALQQCNQFLHKNQFELIPIYDTAGGVFQLLDESDDTVAAIAGSHFEKDNRFKILKKKISNHDENFTRFLLIGDLEPDLKFQPNKVSSVLISDDKPGSLLKALNVFEQLNINLTKLESRPILGRPWEYKFYIDFELKNDNELKVIVKKIVDVSKEFKILGYYPKFTP